MTWSGMIDNRLKKVDDSLLPWLLVIHSPLVGFLLQHLGALHTLAEGQEAVDFHQSNCKKPSSASRPFAVWPKSKGCRNFKRLLFEEGDKLSKEVWVGQEWKPKLWSRGHRFLFNKKSIINKILAIRLEGLFWTRNNVDAPLGLDFGLGLWRLHTMTVQVKRPWEFMAKGLDVGLGLGLTLCPAEGSTYYILLAMYFQPISLVSKQSLATQSHGLSTWTAIVWSGPNKWWISNHATPRLPIGVPSVDVHI